MNLDEIASRVYIMTLFIRSDGERFLLGGGKYPFSHRKEMAFFVFACYNNRYCSSSCYGVVCGMGGEARPV